MPCSQEQARAWGSSRAGPAQSPTQQTRASSPRVDASLLRSSAKCRGHTAQKPQFNRAGRHRAETGFLSLCPQWSPPPPWPPDLGAKFCYGQGLARWGPQSLPGLRQYPTQSPRPGQRVCLSHPWNPSWTAQHRPWDGAMYQGLHQALPVAVHPNHSGDSQGPVRGRFCHHYKPFCSQAVRLVRRPPWSPHTSFFATQGISM